VLLFGHVSGVGSPPFVFNWSLPNGRSALGATIPYSATTVGDFAIRLSIEDSAGVTWNGTLLLRVNPAITFVAHAATPNFFSGRSVAFGATISGGTAPYSYEWIFGDGSSSSAASPTHLYHASGTFAVAVWVNDSGHGTFHQTLEVKVLRSAGGLVWQLETWPEWALLVLLAGVVVVVALLTVVYRRHSTRKRATPVSAPATRPPFR